MNKNKGPILLIEEEPLTEKEMETILPYTFIIKKTIKDSIAVLNNTDTISLIIIDDLIKDPLKLIALIRKRTNFIPIFMMTSSLSMKTKAIKTGITGFIYPPFDVEEIEKVLSIYCHKVKL
jgi:DNA-binding NtrC family response regulator